MSMYPSFRTQFDLMPRIETECGDPVKTVYSPQYDENGNLTLAATGKENLYDYIQSHKDSVDIHVLMQRYAEGDQSVLMQRIASYGDFTEAPKTMAEVLDSINRGRLVWDSLPVEVRAQFGHSFADFVQDAGSEEWSRKLGLIEEEPISVDDVKEVEPVE